MTQRAIQLELWEQMLEIASDMLKRTRKMNALKEESHYEMAKFKSTEKQYESVVSSIESLTMDYTEDEKNKKVKPFINFLNKKLKEIRKSAMPYIKKDLEMRELSKNIEVNKQYLKSFEEFFKDIKLKKEEISKDKLYEICIILMIANEIDASITEENFFEEKEDFYEAIRRSNDSILIDLLEYGDIAKSNCLENFLINV